MRTPPFVVSKNRSAPRTILICHCRSNHDFWRGSAEVKAIGLFRRFLYFLLAGYFNMIFGERRQE
jgi:hypothetical protein